MTKHLVDYTAMSLKDMLSSTNPATTPLLWNSPCIHIEVVRSTQDQGIILSAKAAAFHGAGVVVARVVKLCQCNGAFDLVEHWWKTSPKAQQTIATVVPSNMHRCTSPTLFLRLDNAGNRTSRRPMCRHSAHTSILQQATPRSTKVPQTNSHLDIIWNLTIA